MAANHPGPGMLPFGLSVLLVVGGILLVGRQLIAPVAGPAAPDKSTVIHVVAVIAIMAVTVTLFERLGFILSVGLMLAAILVRVGTKIHRRRGDRSGSHALALLGAFRRSPWRAPAPGTLVVLTTPPP